MAHFVGIRTEDAARYFATFKHTNHGLLVHSWLYLGHAYAAMDEPQKARDYYELFAKSWSQCDPELVPLREQAEAGLARLGRVADGTDAHTDTRLTGT